MKNKLLMGLLSLAIAFGLWVYVITVVSPESETTIYDIPVSLEGENILHEHGLMITENLDPTVDLTIMGNRTDLVNLNKSNITITVDVSKIDRAGTLRSVYEVSFPGDIPNNAISTQHKDPDRVRLVVQERISKNVPVVLDYGRSELPVGYEIEEETLDIALVPVVGPKAVVDQITQAVVSVDLTDRTQTIYESFPFTLCSEDGQPVEDIGKLTVELDEIKATVKIVHYKDLPLVATVLPGAGATEDNSSIEISPKTLRVYGSEKNLAELKEILLTEAIDLGQILTDEGEVKTLTYVLPPEVTTKEEGNEATVTVTFPELKTAEFTLSVDQVALNHLPEGLQAQVDPETEITVKVRGDAALIDTLTQEDFLMSINLSGVKVGSQKLELQIALVDEYAGIGFISATASAMVTVRQAETDMSRMAEVS